MKKIYLSLLAATFALTGTAQKMELQAGESLPVTRVSNIETTYGASNKVSSAVISDTLWYFFNKHFFRNTPPTNGSFPTFKNAATYTNTNFPQRWGAVFLNSGPVAVTGAEMLTFAQASSPSSSVNVGLYLYNVVGGVPSGAPVNSCIASVPQATSGSNYGCDFTLPSLVSGDYAIIAKNISSVVGDTIRVFFTNAKQFTSTATSSEKFGEGLGITGTSAAFFPMTGLFTPTNTTDYEPLVMPRVTYSVTTDHNFTSATICNTTAVTYVNMSSAWINHRQYNMNRFWKHWFPFGNVTGYTAVANKDSVYTWDFGNASPFVYDVSPTYSYPNGGSFTGLLTSKIMKSSSFAVILDSKTWNVTVSVCNVGLTENNIENQFAVYPNPANNNVTIYLNNANDNTQIEVLNALGQVVLTQRGNVYKNELNVETLSNGVYFVKVRDGKQSSTSKLIIEK